MIILYFNSINANLKNDLKEVFDRSHLVRSFRNVNVRVEFPSIPFPIFCALCASLCKYYFNEYIYIVIDYVSNSDTGEIRWHTR